MPTKEGQRGLGRTKDDLTAHPPLGRSCFLGIAIDDYTAMKPLNNAVRDMEAVRDILLSDYDLEPNSYRLLRNEEATRKNILRTLRELPRWVEPHDKLIIYYSGHGHVDEFKDGFWVPVNGKLSEVDDFVSNVELRNILAKLPFRHILLISDACFSGSLFVRGADRADAAANELEVRPSRWALCSGRHDQLVADGPPGEHSPFAASILTELRHNTNDTLRIGTLADRVIELTRANYDQLPEGNPLQGVGHQGGQYVFRRRVDEAAIWDNTSREDTVDAYQAFLVDFPEGEYAHRARLAIQEKEQQATLREEIQDATEEIASGKITKAERLLKAIRKDVEKQLTREDLKASLLDEVEWHLAFCQHYPAYRPIFEKILGSNQASLEAITAEKDQLKADLAAARKALAELKNQLVDKTTSAQKATEALAQNQAAAAATEKALQATIAKLEKQLAESIKYTPPPATPAKAVPIASPSKQNMVFIKGGTFDMGDVMGDKESYNETVHSVTVSDFYLARTPVTFAEYDRFCEAIKRPKPNDKGWGRGNRPVINVNWYDVVEYCNWLSEQQGLMSFYNIDKTRKDPNNKNSSDDLKWTVTPNWNANGYRLPTEAEWEYAAREGGKKVRFGNGKDVIDPKYINFNASENHKKSYSVVGEYRSKTVPVGSLNSPNALGLHDMSGNVREWCWDWDGSYPTAAQINPKGADQGTYRVLRGGSWGYYPQYCRAANRDSWFPSYRYDIIGFRLARS
ncbi:MAG: SUMF1/EgtB/PvdO family nonheme iron enzyme [Saprospiraceae bacterium]